MIPIEEEAAAIRVIQRAIAGKKAKWTAGKTSVSQLSPDEQKQLCGLLIRPVPKELRVKPSILAALPSYFDWRNRNGVDWTTRIKNQQACGSCWAFASIATIESQYNIQTGVPDQNRDLSEQYMLSCSPGSCNGWYIGDTMNWLKIPQWKPGSPQGAPDEVCFPYQGNDTIPCTNACSDHLNRLYYLRDWHYMATDGTTIKNFILTAPVPAGMAVYADFYTYKSGVYEHVSGDFQGYHLVAIVGWDDNNSCWIVKNSWGSNWGESGWFKIKYGQCEIEQYITQFDRVGAGFGAIRCETTPSGAEISIDGSPLGQNTPYIIENIAAYPFEISYHLEGYDDCKKQVYVSPDIIIDCYCDLSAPTPKFLACLCPRIFGGQLMPRLEQKVIFPRVGCMMKESESNILK